MKLDPEFQYDAFRFVLEGVRNPEMEAFFGLPTHVNPENSIQGWFERIQARIKQLPLLLDPDFVDANLNFLLAQVGWDGSPEVDFVSGLPDATKRKLIALSVPLWKLKGTDSGLIGALRIFTGKTVIIRNWFFHRWILDEAGFWYEDRGIDMWLHGTRYTEADDELQWIILNRTNIGATDRRLIYDLLTYLHTSGEHFGVVYAAFVDDFGRGKAGIDLGGPDEILPTFPQWFNTGLATGADFAETRQKAELSTGGILKTRTPQADIETWGPTQRISAQILVGDTAAHIAAGYEFEIRGMISEDESRWYAAVVDDTGLAKIERDGVPIVSDAAAFPPPIDGTQFGIELVIEPTDAATVKVSLLVGANEVLSTSFLGLEAYDDPDGAVEIRGNSGAFFVDNVVVLATPNRVQYVGQNAIPPSFGLGGPSYIANPDPGLEEFEG